MHRWEKRHKPVGGSFKWQSSVICWYFGVNKVLNFVLKRDVSKQRMFLAQPCFAASLGILSTRARGINSFTKPFLSIVIVHYKTTCVVLCAHIVPLHHWDNSKTSHRSMCFICWVVTVIASAISEQFGCDWLRMYLLITTPSNLEYTFPSHFALCIAAHTWTKIAGALGDIHFACPKNFHFALVALWTIYIGS